MLFRDLNQKAIYQGLGLRLITLYVVYVELFWGETAKGGNTSADDVIRVAIVSIRGFRISICSQGLIESILGSFYSAK